MSERRDFGLILARGGSQRMGRPKGLCVADDDPRTLLARVASLYLVRDDHVAVVATPDLAEAYARILAPGPVIVVTGAAGAGTARTVLLGVQALAHRATHLWLHPVDLPRIGPTTLADLMNHSLDHPDEVIVPCWRERRGHPVVLPTRPPEGGWPQDHPGDMRELLAEGCFRIRCVSCDDPGVCDDLDHPRDLKAGPAGENPGDD